MGDFHQNGVITTLHNLTQRPIDSLEEDLLRFSKKRPMGLIIPTLFSEFETPALETVVQELKKVNYIDQVVIGIDRANEEQFRRALDFFSVLPQKTSILWNDGPALSKLHRKLGSLDLAPESPGKGRNVWYCMGYVQAATKVEAVALHDADIRSYDRSLLARLLYPIANPKFNYQFCKGFYSRISDNRLYGRVCRLLVNPLIQALRKVSGDVEYLRFMGGFKYTLAGEFAFRRDVLIDIGIPCDWGLEVGILSEIHRNYANNHVCQIDIADTYDHKHQALSADDETSGLSKMSIDICKTLFSNLAAEGTIFNHEALGVLKATYLGTALEYIHAYRDDAFFNGLEYDIRQEERTIELFADNIIRAGDTFLKHPRDEPFIPSWNRVTSALPDFLEEFSAAVEEDFEQFH